MASACVNNNVTVSQDFSPYGCFNPRASSSFAASEKQIPPEEQVRAGDFEFRLEEPVEVLPADELFSEGKLATKQNTTEKVDATDNCGKTEAEIEISGGGDGGLFSPKAPRCSSRWRELLGLKRFSTNSKTAPRTTIHSNLNSRTASTTSFHSNPSISRSSTSSLKQFLNRTSKTSSSSSDASASLPLLKDFSDSESLSISSSRMSLSSSSSGHDHDDVPRLSLDAERPNHNHNQLLLNQHITANPFAPSRSQNSNNPPRMRMGRSPMRPDLAMSRGVSVDSPRLNSSGKIVFQSLERSSSSPSSFNGGTSGYRHRGMERSYSANVRVTPVLNVFGSFSSNNRASGINRGRNSTDRI